MSIDIQRNVPIGKHTFYGIGGPADEFYKIKNTEGFDELWRETRGEKIPNMILGKGSNTLFSDNGFRGRIFSLEFKKTQWIQPNIVTVEVGKNWQEFVLEANKKGFHDLCNLSGIPGNVGGFIRGNAGAFQMETKDKIHHVTYLDENGNKQIKTKEQCQFGYRESIFKKNPQWCILSGTFELNEKGNAEEALEKSKKLQKERWEKYPPGKSGGSFFKNPKDNFAGKLLDELGAKGDQIGMAHIADKHANFIINKEGKATQRDIIALARKWKQKVWETYQINLEPEIFICDEYGKKIEL